MKVLAQPKDAFLNESQEARLGVLFDAIVPGDDRAPSATEVGAVKFLSLNLARDDYYEVPGWRTLYADGLAALDAASSSHNGGRGLADLSKEEATALLERLAKGELQGMPEGFDQRRFFSTLRGHCVEGCFADPRWGGNRNELMWGWYGYSAPARDFDRPSGTLEGTPRHGD